MRNIVGKIREFFWGWADSFLEYANIVKIIQPVMTAKDVSRSKKRDILNDGVNQLTESTFRRKTIARSIIRMINMKEEVSKEYENTEAQVKGILSWLPRMEYYKELLEKTVREKRELYNLPL